jgi:hypothetical protein
MCKRFESIYHENGWGYPYYTIKDKIELLRVGGQEYKDGKQDEERHKEVSRLHDLHCKDGCKVICCDYCSKQADYLGANDPGIHGSAKEQTRGNWCDACFSKRFKEYWDKRSK